MITRFWAGIAAPGLTREAFQRHWFDVHARFGAGLPGLRAYRQNHVVTAPELPWAAPAFDGCSELSWDDVAAMRSAFDSPQIQEADEDERLFADPDRFGVFVGERRELSGSPGEAPYRLLTFLRVGRSTDREALADVVRNRAAEVVERTGAVGHELFVAVDDPGEPLACDVVDSLWFERREGVAAVGELLVETGRRLAGFAFGREVALVTPRRIV